jgi:hypothetical protein
MATLATFFRSSTVHPNMPAPLSSDTFELRPLPNDHIYFYSKRIDNSRMVRQANPAAAQESWSAAGALVVLLMLGASIIAPHVASVLAGYRLEALKQERQAMIDQDRALTVREAALLSPSRLIELAASRRLASPAVDQIVHLDNVAADIAVASVQTTALRNSQ